MRIVHYGKINLSLQILGKREDGYHLLDTVMQEVDVSDILHMEPASITTLRCDHPMVPTDESNLVLRAHQAMKNRYAVGEVSYHLEKHIPMAAGMGGGSANAAAALQGINQMFGLGLSQSELARVGISLGADIPYFLYGGTCRARGIGEVLDPLPSYGGIPILLINDGTPVSTQAVYQKGPKRSVSTVDLLVEQLQNNQTKLTVQNDLADIVYAMHPHLCAIETDLLAHGADTALLSGSGATMFGIFQNALDCVAAKEALQDKYHWVCATQTR